ncbi:hypothetical protein LJR296_007954 [Cupriavidus necator]|uniref:hypothetical protein n=1 Tax=Cupriavidus necator TaxID=106590 RepID=UPI003ECEC1F5
MSNAKETKGQKQPTTVRIRIKAGAEWRGVKYFEPCEYDLSTEYARHVVETLGVAEYVTDERA